MTNGRPRDKFQAHKGLRQGDLLSPFLFNLVVDVLMRLIDKAKAMDLIRGLEMGRDKVEVSHIQFADDTLLFVKKEDHIRFLVDVVTSFCNMFGLKINLEKSDLLGINCEEEDVEELAQQTGCGMEIWPIKYFGWGASRRKSIKNFVLETDFNKAVKEVGKLEESIFVKRRAVNVDCSGFECFVDVFYVPF